MGGPPEGDGEKQRRRFLIIDGGSDTFEAAKAAALFEAKAILGLSPRKG
jgi:hypothetical protein